jgi:lactoylglutathione lyase
MALIVLALGTATATAQDVRRPQITGVAHMALYIHDVDRSLTFYRDFLGYDEALRLHRGGGELHLAFVKINDRQFLEIFPEKEAGTDRLNHIALEVEDAKAMRLYLASRGVTVLEKVPVGRIGNANYNIVDPEGHTVEIVQYVPDGRTARNHGQNLPDTRIAPRMSHLGIAVGSLDKALRSMAESSGSRRPGAAAPRGKS